MQEKILIGVAVMAAFLLGFILSPLHQITAILFDATPRTALTTAGLAALVRAALPQASISPLSLSIIALAIGFFTDRLL
ncbi:MAG: hypothetical protein QXO15_00020 [Nitrososphaerota archaeon]